MYIKVIASQRSVDFFGTQCIEALTWGHTNHFAVSVTSLQFPIQVHFFPLFSQFHFQPKKEHFSSCDLELWPLNLSRWCQGKSPCSICRQSFRSKFTVWKYTLIHTAVRLQYPAIKWLVNRSITKQTLAGNIKDPQLQLGMVHANYTQHTQSYVQQKTTQNYKCHKHENSRSNDVD